MDELISDTTHESLNLFTNEKPSLFCAPADVLSLIISLSSNLSELSTWRVVSKIFKILVKNTHWRTGTISVHRGIFLNFLARNFKICKLRILFKLDATKSYPQFNYLEYIELHEKVSPEIVATFVNCEQIYIYKPLCVFPKSNLKCVKNVKSISIKIHENSLHELKYLVGCDDAHIECWEFTDDDFKYFKSCKGVQITSGGLFDGHGLKYLNRCTKLNLENLGSSGKFKAENLFCVKKCTNLTITDCDKVTKGSICHMNLTKIILSYCEQVTDSWLCMFKKCTHVNLMYCVKITDIGVSFLENVTNVNVTGCKLLTDKSCQYFSKCDHISMGENQNITGKYFYHWNMCTELDISASSRVTDFSHCTRVEKIIANECALADTDLQYFSACKSVGIFLCENVSDTGLKYLINCESINISSNKITDLGLSFLGNIKSINIQGNEHVTDEGISYFSKCHTVSIVDCLKLTPKIFDYLQHCQELAIFACPLIKNADIVQFFDILLLKSPSDVKAHPNLLYYTFQGAFDSLDPIENISKLLY